MCSSRSYSCFRVVIVVVDDRTGFMQLLKQALLLLRPLRHSGLRSAQQAVFAREQVAVQHMSMSSLLPAVSAVALHVCLCLLIMLHGVSSTSADLPVVAALDVTKPGDSISSINSYLTCPLSVTATDMFSCSVTLRTRQQVPVGDESFIPYMQVSEPAVLRANFTMDAVGQFTVGLQVSVVSVGLSLSVRRTDLISRKCVLVRTCRYPLVS